MRRSRRDAAQDYRAGIIEKLFLLNHASSGDGYKRGLKREESGLELV